MDALVRTTQRLMEAPRFVKTDRAHPVSLLWQCRDGGRKIGYHFRGTKLFCPCSIEQTWVERLQTTCSPFW